MQTTPDAISTRTMNLLAFALLPGLVIVVKLKQLKQADSISINKFSSFSPKKHISFTRIYTAYGMPHTIYLGGLKLISNHQNRYLYRESDKDR